MAPSRAVVNGVNGDSKGVDTQRWHAGAGTCDEYGTVAGIPNRGDCLPPPRPRKLSAEYVATGAGMIAGWGAVFAVAAVLVASLPAVAQDSGQRIARAGA